LRKRVDRWGDEVVVSFISTGRRSREEGGEEEPSKTVNLIGKEECGGGIRGLGEEMPPNNYLR